MYLVCDNGTPVNACDTGTLYIDVIFNQTPVAENDTIFVIDDIPGIVNVLTNDFDPNDTSFGYLINNVPSKGIVQDLGNGNLQYVANQPFNGIDTFTYLIFDDGLPQLTDQATVVIFATKTNLPPVASDDTIFIDQADDATIQVLANDTDAEGDELIVTILNQPFSGNITLNNDGSITYASDPFYSGVDLFSYVVCDTTPGCDTATVFININEFTFDDLIAGIPNVFSPNGDGYNEFFQIKNIENYPKNTLTVFNRWGELVYENNQYQNDWNGSYRLSNEPLPSGTYYYTIRIVDFDNQTFFQSGFLQIIRD